MRIDLDWLGEWIELPETAELIERLDMGGFEDTAVENTGPDLSAVRVGRVIERSPHPNADRLSLCRVDLGDGDPVEIVCGAPNVAAGQKVAVASPGTRLPDGTKLKQAKIRGVRSLGMICSMRELGLGEEHAGILVLPEDAPVGAPLPDVVPCGARVLEVGITPNRGDTASLLGIAREVRAHFGGEIRAPEIAPPESGDPAASAAKVSIEAPDACHRYVARIVRGVRVGPSPAGVQRRLEACGVRAINNVVDATNLVLLELGQPLHAFDLDTLRGAEVRVRRARAGEKLATLDGSTRELDPDDLVIADAERPIALAGVMGGAETEVSERTTDVLIECAHFHPTPVRLSARRHGLHTEASYRFERGVDRDGIARAADRCARVMAELSQAAVAPGAVEALGEPPATPGPIRLECERANRLLGTDLAPDAMRALLERVGVVCEVPEPGVLLGSVPSHRNDLHVHQDLTEEIARIHGYDRIPTSEPVGVLRPAELPHTLAIAERARDALAGAGITETVLFPFVDAAEIAALRLPPDDPRLRMPTLANPYREEEPHLRSTLLPSLLRAARQNRARQVERVRLFEVSRVFRARGAGELPEEPLQLAAVIARGESPGVWQGPPAPIFYEARGVAERLFFLLGYAPVLQREGHPPYLHPGAAANLIVGGAAVGSVGELHPEVAAHFEIDVPCAVLEVDLGQLLASNPSPPRFREVSRFPQVRRDLAVFVSSEQEAGELLEAARRAAGQDCISAELFDRYEGRGVPEGRVSLAFRLVFQRADRTLTDAEVTPAVERVVSVLTDRLGGVVRQGGAPEGKGA